MGDVAPLLFGRNDHLARLYRPLDDVLKRQVHLHMAVVGAGDGWNIGTQAKGSRLICPSRLRCRHMHA